MPLGDVTSLVTRYCYTFINARKRWDDIVEISACVKAELKFWAQNLRHIETCLLNPVVYIRKTAAYTDASDTGLGVTLVRHAERGIMQLECFLRVNTACPPPIENY